MPVETTAALLVVAAEPELSNFTPSAFSRLFANSTAAALQQIDQVRPRLVMVDLDAPSIDGPAVCEAAGRMATTSVLVITDSPHRAPAALRAGCHAVLLKPFAPNLLAARFGRLTRERSQQQRVRTLRGTSHGGADGTNRVWEAIACPHCQTPGVTSFEFHSHRRMWFACLACSAVWLGARQE